MADIDAQVQIRIIDLSEKWADLAWHTEGSKPIAPEPIIESRAKKFDQAYKAIAKTVTSG